MFELSEKAHAQIEIKGSKFLCFLLPCNDIRSIRCVQATLKSQHPKSVHTVYAARAMNSNAQVVEDFSDDGEPKGSSAAPMLNVLRGADLLAAAYVVRYFGGTLLGIGGLVRAYSSALNAAILAAKDAGAIIPYIKKRDFALLVPYEFWRQIEYFCAEFEYSATFSSCVELALKLSDEQAAQLDVFLREKYPQLKLTPRG